MLARRGQVNLACRLGQGKAIIFGVLSHPRLITFCSYWLPPLLLTGLVLLFSGELGSVEYTQSIIDLVRAWFPALTKKQANLLHFLLRKSGHFFTYALLFIAWVRTLRWHLDFSPRWAILLALTINLAVALVDEGAQSRVASRTSDLQDVLLDFSGAITATLIICPFLRQVPGWKKKNSR